MMDISNCSGSITTMDTVMFPKMEYTTPSIYGVSSRYQVHMQKLPVDDIGQALTNLQSTQ